ncbi:MAG: DUF3048 domain-containing protein, partial [Clostridia bacterium]|nr:DUF3048 domain-containing protein [Clostridia bacterium]
VLYPNPLSGISQLKDGQLNKRPVAVMINNISTAQGVQCGLNDADLVFECLVEGGISRLMAVYYDVEQAGQIGSIRSARYTYVQLARGLDAAYVHCGSDQVYTKPYMNDLGMDHYDIGGYPGSSFRENNGLAFEHRLFTTGEKLSAGLAKNGWRTESKKDITPNAFTFPEEELTFDTPCNKVTFVMSDSYKTTFSYNPETKKYTRQPMGKTHKDDKTGEDTVTDNVFILYAKSPMFDDNYHLRTILSKGEGLYVSGGTCTPIQWEKGDASDPLQFFTQEGEELKINTGSSWIAFPPTANESKTKVE